MGRKKHTAEEIVAKLRQVDILVSHGRFIRPVALIHEWIDAAGIADEPVLRSGDRANLATPARLTTQAVGDIIKVHAKAAGGGVDLARIMD